MNTPANNQAAAQPGEPMAQPMPESTTAAIDPKEYQGKEVVTAQGDKVGKVAKLVISNSDRQAYAVVGVGGFLGMGQKDAAIPLDQLQPQEDKLVLSAGITEDALKSGMMYQESEFSAFETTQQAPADEMKGKEGNAPAEK